MFLNIDTHDSNQIAVIDDRGCTLTYAELADQVRNLFKDVAERSVVFILSKNCSDSLAGYLAMIERGIIPLILNEKIDRELLDRLISTYEPAYLFAPCEEAKLFNYKAVDDHNEYVLLETGNKLYSVNDDLQFLMTTSGSTGSPKLVRYKKGNLEANAANVSKAFGWTKDERAICDLGMQYTMGLNVINAHLCVGATVLLTNHNIMSSDYWDFVKKNKGTNFTGVPFSYDILHRLHIDRMDIDSIRTFSQGGGKLTDERFSEFAGYCDKTGRRFIASFGTTETSARMCMLDPKLATSKIGSIGKPIPGGEAFLIDQEGNVIDEPGAEGELCYRGPNVTMGYAICKEDLGRSDDWNCEYHTGDLAYRDADGCYYVTGRKGRFLKLLGHRVGLDECERLISDMFDCGCACIGDDNGMRVFVDKEVDPGDIAKYLEQKLGLYKNLFDARYISEIPRNDRGKTDYSKLKGI